MGRTDDSAPFVQVRAGGGSGVCVGGEKRDERSAASGQRASVGASSWTLPSSSRSTSPPLLEQLLLGVVGASCCCCTPYRAIGLARAERVQSPWYGGTGRPCISSPADRRDGTLILVEVIARRQTLVLLIHALTQIVVFVLRPTTAYRRSSWTFRPPVSGCCQPVRARAAGSRRTVGTVRRPPRRSASCWSAARSSVSRACCSSASAAASPGWSPRASRSEWHSCVRSSGSNPWSRTPRGPGRYDTAFGHYTFAASLGQMFGPAMIVLFGGSETIPDTSRIFVGSTVLVLLLVVYTFLLRGAPQDRPAAASEQRASHAPPHSRADARHRGEWCRARGGGHHPGLSTRIGCRARPRLRRHRAAACRTGGVVDGCAALPRSPLALVGRQRLLLISVFITALTLVLASLALPLWLLVVAVTLLGFGLGVAPPLTMSWVAEAAPPGLRVERSRSGSR